MWECLTGKEPYPHLDQVNTALAVIKGETLPIPAACPVALGNLSINLSVYMLYLYIYLSINLSIYLFLYYHIVGDLMKRCWKMNPNQRPSFQELVSELTKLTQQLFPS